MFRDVFGPGEFGLHHMALICTDYETERDAYLAAGAELAFEGRGRHEPHVAGSTPRPPSAS